MPATVQNTWLKRNELYLTERLCSDYKADNHVISVVTELHLWNCMLSFATRLYGFNGSVKRSVRLGYINNYIGRYLRSKIANSVLSNAAIGSYTFVSMLLNYNVLAYCNSLWTLYVPKSSLIWDYSVNYSVRNCFKLIIEIFCVFELDCMPNFCSVLVLVLICPTDVFWCSCHAPWFRCLLFSLFLSHYVVISL